MNRAFHYLKDEFIEASKKSVEDGNKNTVYTTKMLCCLKQMARHDVYPDGRFGDDDCIVWEMMRR